MSRPRDTPSLYPLTTTATSSSTDSSNFPWSPTTTTTTTTTTTNDLSSPHPKDQTGQSKQQHKQQHKQQTKRKALATKVSKMTSWLSTAEPSAQALARHQKETLQNAGIDPSRARTGDLAAKLHAPIGEIPADAVRPAAGPDPEEVLRRRRKEAAEKSARGVSDGPGGGSGFWGDLPSPRSGSGRKVSVSTVSSPAAVVAPWEDECLDNWRG